MADGAVAGITLPPGDPGAVRDSASQLKRIASGFGQTGDTARAAAASVSWTGTASEAFGQRTGDYQQAGHQADTACMRAATALSHFAHRLQEGRDKVKRIQDHAADVETRMHAAQKAADTAGQQAAAARQKASDMTFSTSLDLSGASMAEQNQALQDADAFEGDQIRYQGIANRAADELETLRKQAKDERDAVKDAATAAAGHVNGAQDTLPVVYQGSAYGSAGAMEDRVLAHVRAGDFTVLAGLPLNTLDEGTQRAVGAEMAKAANQAAVNKGGHSIESVGGIVNSFKNDKDFDVGFYNQLGGRGASDFVHNLIFFHGKGDGLHGADLVALMAPFAGALSGATRSKQLRKDFTDGFFRKDLKVSDRDHDQIPAFLMAAPAAGYGSRFLARAGREYLIDPKDPTQDESMSPWYELSDHQDFMQFMSGNPEASGLLLAGHHGPDNHLTNVGTLFLYGPRYTDDGHALNALLQSGTHDLLAQDPKLANAAAHNVILGAPEFDRGYPDGARPALVTVLRDHVVDFDRAAVDVSDPGLVGGPRDVPINYSQGHDYLKMLFGNDATAPDTGHIVGQRIGDDMRQAILGQGPGHEDYANRAGALSELSLHASGDANLDSAHAQDVSNEIKGGVLEKGIDFAAKKIPVPGVDKAVNEAANLFVGKIFPTDAVEHGLQKQQIDQISALQHFDSLTVTMKVHAGQLPHEALKMLSPDGGSTPAFTGGAGSNDVAVTDGSGHARPFDLNQDGRIEPNERVVTERELHDAAMGPGGNAQGSFERAFSHTHHDG